MAWTKSLEPGNSPELYKLVVLYEKEEQVQRVEHKCLTKQELLETLPALNKYYWAIAK